MLIFASCLKQMAFREVASTIISQDLGVYGMVFEITQLS
nr:MAG TPA: Sex factor F TraW protein N terminal [Caudoviricetes sp.]